MNYKIHNFNKILNYKYKLKNINAFVKINISDIFD